MISKVDNKKALLTIEVADAILAATILADGTYAPDAQPDFPRNITIDVTTSTADAGTVTVRGIDATTGLPNEEVLDLSGATSLVGTISFSSITEIIVADLANEDPGDTFVVGVGSNIQLTVGRSTLISVIVSADDGDVGPFKLIDGTSGTTTDAAELKLDIDAGVYEYNVSFAEGIRVIMDGDTPVTIVYNQ